MPITLPAHAPTPRVGMNIPAGTLIPNVTMVNAALTINATSSEYIIGRACSDGLRTHSPEWVLGLPALHSANRLYTNSVPPMRVYGLMKQRIVVMAVICEG